MPSQSRVATGVVTRGFPSLKRSAGFWLALGGMLVLRYAVPAPEGLTEPGLATLSVFFLAVVLWVTEAIAPVETGVAILVLLPLLGAVSFQSALAGLGDPLLWLIFGAFVLAAALSKVGLDRRIAFGILRLAGGTSFSIVVFMFGVQLAFLFLVPSSVGRMVLVLPILTGVASALRLEPKKSNLAKILFIGLPFASITLTQGLTTGASSTAMASSLLSQSIHVTLSWRRYAALMLPVALTTTALLVPILLWIFPPERRVEDGTTYIRAEYEKLGRMSTDEWKLMALFLLLLGLFATGGSLHHMGEGLTAVLIGSLTFLPGLRVHSWAEVQRKIDWGVLLLFGAGLALAHALDSTGAGRWIAHAASGGAHLPPTALAALVMTNITVAHIGFASMTAMVSAAIPVTVAVAAQMGYNPLWMGLVTIMATGMAFILPMQSPTNLVTYGVGYYDIKDMMRVGMPCVVMVIGVTLFFASFYWPWLGVRP
jgi:solute carrier family 13 (sodium-dependent dicarboxylate transporter), member 2/3/5